MKQQLRLGERFKSVLWKSNRCFLIGNQKYQQNKRLACYTEKFLYCYHNSSRYNSIVTGGPVENLEKFPIQYRKTQLVGKTIRFGIYFHSDVGRMVAGFVDKDVMRECCATHRVVMIDTHTHTHTLQNFAPKSLAESLGSDYMHDSQRDSLRDSFFYAGLCDWKFTYIKSDFILRKSECHGRSSCYI